jgi:DNA (cytosine-5)-methyltransferase 1
VKPRLLDLFCGAGGAARGYQRAGFHVTGVDVAGQPRYAGDEFVQADALEFIFDWGNVDSEGRKWAAIHASPPCQAYSTMNNRHGSKSPALINETRLYLEATGLPWVMENVVGAKRHMRSPFVLTGEMFGLGVHRRRLFESNVLIPGIPIPPRQENPVSVYGKLDGRRLWTRADGSVLTAPRTLEPAADAMGIDWMTWDELREAVPPAYTEYIGRFLVAGLGSDQETQP